MNEYWFISLKRAEAMSESKLQIEIGKRAKYLKEQLGMSPDDAANFIGGLLNLGVAMDEIFKKHKENKE